MSFKDLKAINKTDSRIKDLEGRIDYVNNIIDENMETVEDFMAISASDGILADSNPFNITVEQLGTYLLRSNEAGSSRNGDYSFFETEKDYRKLKIGSNSVAVVFGDNDGEYQIEDEGCDTESNLGYETFCERLNSIDTMSGSEISNLLKKGSKVEVLESINQDIAESIKNAHKEILRRLEDEIDIRVVNMVISGMKETEIAKVLGINQSSVNRRFFNICHKKLKM